MPVEPNERSARQQQADKAIATYREAVAAGQEPDRQEFLGRHPEIARELAAFFAESDHLARPPEGEDLGVNRGGDDPTHNLKGPARSGTLIRNEPAGPAPPDTGPPGAGPPPGNVACFFGAYEIQEEIACGGMGIVYKARQARVRDYAGKEARQRLSTVLEICQPDLVTVDVRKDQLQQLVKLLRKQVSDGGAASGQRQA